MVEALLQASDEELLERIEEGDREAFSVLVRRHAGRYYRIAYRILFDKCEAEDMVQEAFLKIWDRPGTWDGRRGAKFTTWFYRVVTNLCLDWNRKRKPLTLADGFQVADNSPGYESKFEAKQEQEVLERAMRELPVRQKLALDLCFYEGLSNRQAAEVMSVSLKALQSLIMRAKESLREKVSRLNLLKEE